jgi:predicted nucleotidyltransferase
MKEEYPGYTIDKGRGIIQKVRKDFAFIEDRYFAILIFGSHAKGYISSISDIDVCIVAKNGLKREIFYNEIYPKVRMDVYDVVIFENCDNELKSEIAKNHIIVYCKDEKGLIRYLEPYKSLEFKGRTLREIVGELRSVINEI